jgi:hypothetical protein
LFLLNAGGYRPPHKTPDPAIDGVQVKIFFVCLLDREQLLFNSYL